MPHRDPTAHGEQTRKDVIRLAPGIWTAVGHAVSNVHTIEGRKTATIVDTTESTAAAANILAEFRKLTAKPVGRIILTHSHRDHISGASVPVLASQLFQSDLFAVDKTRIAANRALGRRTQAQFGMGLTDAERISLGCGPVDRPLEVLGAGYIEPSDRLSANAAIDLDGIASELMSEPGETADHMVVLLPEHKILFCGDNWYHALPNLYAIRGTPYRDFAVWAESLGQLAALDAEIPAPGHTRPVFGAAKIQEVLTTARDAIIYVMQTTADGMGAGLPLDDIVAAAALPEPLASKPWLKELHGKLSWSVRAFAAGTLGWHDGNPTHLGNLSSGERARHMAELAGGTEALMRAAKKTADRQWRLELSDHLIALGQPAMGLKADTLTELAKTEINATARNTDLWEAKRRRTDREPLA